MLSHDKKSRSVDRLFYRQKAGKARLSNCRFQDDRRPIANVNAINKNNQLCVFNSLELYLIDVAFNSKPCIEDEESVISPISFSHAMWLCIEAGIKNLLPAEAVRLAGTDPDYAQRDLYQAIEAGDFPSWRVCLQLMPEQDAEKMTFNPFDVTKVWPHKAYPLLDVGVLELYQNPENYFADVEQAAFSPLNVPPGLGFSPDKMLQGRIFAYHDAHLHRIGTNYQQLPVNRPHCPYHTNQRDGAMRFDGI